jgi:Zn-dependent protease with chaperone function
MRSPTRWGWTSSAERVAGDPIRARWFDGRSSLPAPVLLVLAPTAGGPALTLREIGGEARELTVRGREVGWPEAWSSARAPRSITIDLHDRGTLQVDDPAAWRSAFESAGGRVALAQRMQTRWSVFLGVSVLAVLALVAFYRWGTPWAATEVTREVPLAWELAVADRALADIDRTWLHPSKLPLERQARLRERFEVLARGIDPSLQRYRGYAPKLQLHFRSGMGPNAFALPGGTIVVIDALVEEADKLKLGDEALLGVLAHEAGHVVHRHTTRLVVEQAVLNVGFGLAMGDVSSLVSVASSALTGLAYRRGHESESDCFAIALMRKAGVSTVPMAELLLAIEAGHDKGGAAGIPTALSSHPATHERALALKRGDDSACAR